MFIWILLLVLVAALFVVVEIVVLPRLLFQHAYAYRKIKDRGIKIEKRGNEEIIVYEPDLIMRKHVSQYMLVKNPVGKFLICKTDTKLTYLEYEVVVYGKNNRILTVLNVKDIVGSDGHTEALELPPETAYVSVLVSEADKSKYKNSIFAPINKGRVVIYSVVTVLATFILAFTARIALSFIMGGVFRESILLDGDENAITVAITLVISAIHVLVAGLCIKKRNREIKR